MEHLRTGPDTGHTFAAGLLGVIDVAGGPTEEQRSVLGALVRHLWDAPPDLDAVTPLTPAEVAARLDEGEAPLRFAELAMTLELCRHPQSVAQVERVEAYVAALGVRDIELGIVRTELERGAAAVSVDLDRIYGGILPEISELGLRDRYLHLDAPDPSLAERLRALHDLPPGTLGHAYVEFYLRNGFPLPGDDVHLPAHYVNHDMNHVITGYEPTAPGEVARSGFLAAANPSRRNWIEFLLTMSIHESGVLNHGEIRAKVATLARPGVGDLLGEGLARGRRCRVDLSQLDHLARAAEPLETVRAECGVVPLVHPVVPPEV
jgi:hypothetical protein